MTLHTFKSICIPSLRGFHVLPGKAFNQTNRADLAMEISIGYRGLSTKRVKPG